MAWEVEDGLRLCDSGASFHMTPSADCMLNYREGNLKLRIDDGSTRSSKGFGDGNRCRSALKRSRANAETEYCARSRSPLPRIVTGQSRQNRPNVRGTPHGSFNQFHVSVFNCVPLQVGSYTAHTDTG